MAKKSQLRDLHKDMTLNDTSSEQEKALKRAVERVRESLEEKFVGIELDHKSQWLLKNIVERLRKEFPDENFICTSNRSSMRPDGGILSIVSKNGDTYPILISEKKNQGTNDLREREGKKKQSKGNAVERLGKNVIGFRTAMLNERIFPFVCFGDGCDFSEGSTILDRVIAIAEFGPLNEEHLHKTGPNGLFDRGTFFFRVAEWTEDEMFEKCYSIAEKSVYYFFSKYGQDSFL